MVRLGRDPHGPCRRRCAEANRKRRAHRNRHLAEDVPGKPFAHHALDPVDALDDLDSAFEHREQRPLVAFVSRVLPRREADVGRPEREPLALTQIDSGYLAGADTGSFGSLPAAATTVTPAATAAFTALRSEALDGPPKLMLMTCIWFLTAHSMPSTMVAGVPPPSASSTFTA